MVHLKSSGLKKEEETYDWDYVCSHEGIYKPEGSDYRIITFRCGNLKRDEFITLHYSTIKKFYHISKKEINWNDKFFTKLDEAYSIVVDGEIPSVFN